MTNPVLSIIIPCYNSGKYLPDALDSVKSYRDNEIYEVIIVNDGSTDRQTIALLQQLAKEGFTILNQENKGVAAARNAGVKIARGEYILLLDSDNRITSDYIKKGIDILSGRPEISIVHARPSFFGDSTEPRFVTAEFDMAKILKENYIDNCSIIRKKIWAALNGQDENRVIMSHADWEFWIRAGAAGYKFYYIDEILFEYRNLDDSMVKQVMGLGSNAPVLSYIYGKHAALFAGEYAMLYNQYTFYLEDQRKPFRSFLKFFYKRYFSKSSN